MRPTLSTLSTLSAQSTTDGTRRRRPWRRLGVGAAAVALALAACGGAAEDTEGGEDAAAPPAAEEEASDGGGDEATPSEEDGSGSGTGSEDPADGSGDEQDEGDAAQDEESPTEDDGESSGSDDSDSSSQEEGAGPAPTGLPAFPQLALAPLVNAEGEDEMSAEELAEAAAPLLGVYPDETTCESGLSDDNRGPVECGAGEATVQAFFVQGGVGGTEPYYLLSGEELPAERAEQVQDPSVSVFYGPTTLFYDDPELVTGDGLTERAQEEIVNLGLEELVEVFECTGEEGGENGTTSVTCTGSSVGFGDPAQVELTPSISASGDPVTVAVVTWEGEF